MIAAPCVWFWVWWYTFVVPIGLVLVLRLTFRTVRGYPRDRDSRP